MNASHAIHATSHPAPVPGSMLARAVAHGLELHAGYRAQGLNDPAARSLAASRACLRFGTGRADTLAGLCRALDARSYRPLDVGAL